jgi:hypothetical protein
MASRGATDPPPPDVFCVTSNHRPSSGSPNWFGPIQLFASPIYFVSEWQQLRCWYVEAGEAVSQGLDLGIVLENLGREVGGQLVGCCALGWRALSVPTDRTLRSGTAFTCVFGVRRSYFEVASKQSAAQSQVEVFVP